MTEHKMIMQVNDVTPECLQAAEEVFEGFFDNDGDPIDWYSFLDRLEAYGYSATELDSPAVRKIQRHVRKFRTDK